MRKFISLFILLMFSNISVQAKEPIMATLKNIVSNEVLDFNIGTYNFSCSPYGIFTLEELYRLAKPKSQCKKSIESFYKINSDLQHYGYKRLAVRQSYHVIFKNKKCIVHVAGEKSYSEFLLDEGLAVKIPSTIDKEYEYVFYKSQRKAKIQKKGIWTTSIAKDCISSIYIKN